MDPKIEQMKMFQEQLKEFPTFDLASFVHRNLHPDIAIAFMTIVCPRWYDVEGCILRYEPQEGAFHETLKSLSGDKTNLEKLFNHMHVDDLFDPQFNLAPENMLYLGKSIAAIWKGVASKEFPKKNLASLAEINADGLVEVTLWSV